MIVLDGSFKSLKRLKANIEKIMAKKESSFAKLDAVTLETKIASYKSLRKIYVEQLFAFANDHEQRKKIILTDFFITWKLFNEFMFKLDKVSKVKNTNSALVADITQNTK